ncbi:MAG TPA: hypothetical protein VFS43_09775 [Polyangiaceae bacterium]|nr:hypothetical protein [Polyangiaceae bacterium]
MTSLRLPSAFRPLARPLGLVALTAIVVRGCAPEPPEPSVAGVARFLGRAAGGEVAPGEFVWEAGGSFLEEALFGRRVLFLASRAPGEPRDLYRARVRLSLEGRPVSVASLVNLTSTPLGDESSLTGDGPVARRYAAYSLVAYGAVSTVTLLDLAGDGGVIDAQGALDVALGGLTNLFGTGSWSGVGRTDVSLEHPVPSLRLSFRPDAALAVALPGAPPFEVRASERRAPGATPALVQAVPHLRKPPILWAVDTVRGFVGPGPIAWLEDRFFGARDAVRRARYGAFGPRAPVAVAAAAEASAPAGVEAPPPSPPLDASGAGAGDDEGQWPPAKLPSIWREGEAGEGEWEAVRLPFLKPLPGAQGEAPPYFYKTWIAPDQQRPYAKVLVVAMDTRQLELGMEGGVEDPKPLTGAPSKGRIPREPDVLSRVVGAFNGAFKTTHGAYGMMVDRRVLLPPKPDAATLAVTDAGRVGMGSWRTGEAVPPEMVSFRQNLDPLVEDGTLNPSKRTIWGFQLAGTSVLTERSGVCVTRAGHLFYLWGDDLSGPTLGKAMIQSGCAYGMHLDMNPHHTGFVFLNVRDASKRQYDTRLLTPQMSILPERYLEWSPKDFFYVMLRPFGAPAAAAGGEGAGATGLAWSVDGGAQPAPSWLPAVYEASAEAGGGRVHLYAFDRGRVSFRVRAGRGEGNGGEGAARELDRDESRRVLAAFGLGPTRSGRPLGLMVGGQRAIAFRGRQGVLSIDGEGRLRVGSAPADERAVDAAELPIVLSGGRPTPLADEAGPSRERAAICARGEHVVVAHGPGESDRAVAEALATAGCAEGLALDRGGHEAAWLQRSGTEVGAGVSRGEAPVLYAVATPFKPRGFVWKLGAAGGGPRLKSGATNALACRAASSRFGAQSPTLAGAGLPRASSSGRASERRGPSVTPGRASERRGPSVTPGRASEAARFAGALPPAGL